MRPLLSKESISLMSDEHHDPPDPHSTASEDADYPTEMYHPTQGTIIVHNANEKARLGEGWSDTPFRPPPVRTH
jgi:hypothetical protein